MPAKAEPLPGGPLAPSGARRAIGLFFLFLAATSPPASTRRPRSAHTLCARRRGEGEWASDEGHRRSPAADRCAGARCGSDGRCLRRCFGSAALAGTAMSEAPAGAERARTILDDLIRQRQGHARRRCRGGAPGGQPSRHRVLAVAARARVRRRAGEDGGRVGERVRRMDVRPSTAHGAGGRTSWASRSAGGTQHRNRHRSLVRLQPKPVRRIVVRRTMQVY